MKAAGKEFHEVTDRYRKDCHPAADCFPHLVLHHKYKGAKSDVHAAALKVNKGHTLPLFSVYPDQP